MNTPTPWAVSEDAESARLIFSSAFQVVDCNTKKLVADTSGHLDTTNGEAYDNASLIVRAVNSHQSLIDALSEAVNLFRGGDLTNEQAHALWKADAALALAKEPT